ncbi:MAG: cupredoxin domain-containing protein [Frankia sp.]
MRLRSLAFAALPAAAVITFAAGCGSSSSGGASAPASVSASTSAPAAAAGSGGGAYGGGAATTATTSAASSGAITMHIQNFMFGAVTVPAGAKVEVMNMDSAPHTVNVHGAGIDVQVSAGGTASFTAPSKAGTYALTCDIHPSMSGSLVVS